jgi:hypothetical protein
MLRLLTDKFHFSNANNWTVPRSCSVGKLPAPAVDITDDQTYGLRTLGDELFQIDFDLFIGSIQLIR